jgi:hypothetical protein
MSLSIKYISLRFSICFEDPVRFYVNPLFLIRSVLGKELRACCCTRKGCDCTDCPLHTTCAYVFLFESMKDKDTSILPGLDKSSHPFILKETERWPDSAVKDYSFGMVLLGDAVSFFPYVYIALSRGGEHGVLRARTPYSIVEVESADGSSIQRDDGSVPYGDCIRKWEYVPSESLFCGDVMVSLISPLRFKHQGAYGCDFTEDDFLKCLFRRMTTVISLFGEGNAFGMGLLLGKVKFRSKQVSWVDYSHYSSRQRASMSLGGAEGSFVLEGEFDSLWLALLDFAELFNAGKNVSFGLGTLEIWRKKEVLI